MASATSTASSRTSSTWLTVSDQASAVLSELRVKQLGVIEDMSLVLGPGMTALTGETGAGKTLVVEALELLIGGRADGMLVRPGAFEAAVEGRFLLPSPRALLPTTGAPSEGGGEGAEEVVLSRVVPADGRSRAYIDGRMATAGALAEIGERLVDLHGQHAHQSLFSATAQRDALDLYAGADRGPRDAARAKLRRVEEATARAGGSAAARQREIDLLQFQVAELDAAALTGPDEEATLAAEEEALALASSHREAAGAAYEGLVAEDQVLDRLGQVVGALAGHAPLDDLHDRLRGLLAELADAGSEIRSRSEGFEEDPERLAQVGARRGLLWELRRKYAQAGTGLGAVLAYQAEARARLEELKDLEGTAARLAQEHETVRAELRQASVELGAVRRGAAARLAGAVESELRRLAMPRARFQVLVGGTPPDGPGAYADEAGAEEDFRAWAGEDVSFLLAANPGEPLLPLAKVASGGELARAMLALRLVLLAAGPGEGPSTLVFDEVDAGVGGEAAVAVGKALAELGRRYQVVVVTHLAQVAACANAQVAVTKVETKGRSVTTAVAVSGDQRVIELSRMMSGQPDSETARLHAEELLRSAR